MKRQSAAVSESMFFFDGGFILLTLAFIVDGRWQYVYTTTN